MSTEEKKLGRPAGRYKDEPVIRSSHNVVERLKPGLDKLLSDCGAPSIFMFINLMAEFHEQVGPALAPILKPHMPVTTPKASKKDRELARLSDAAEKLKAKYSPEELEAIKKMLAEGGQAQ